MSVLLPRVNKRRQFGNFDRVGSRAADLTHLPTWSARPQAAETLAAFSFLGAAALPRPGAAPVRILCCSTRRRNRQAAAGRCVCLASAPSGTGQPRPAAFHVASGPEPEPERNPARGFFPLAAPRRRHSSRGKKTVLGSSATTQAEARAAADPAQGFPNLSGRFGIRA